MGGNRGAEAAALPVPSLDQGGLNKNLYHVGKKEIGRQALSEGTGSAARKSLVNSNFGSIFIDFSKIIC